MKLNFTKEELSAALFDHDVFDFIVEEDSIEFKTDYSNDEFYTVVVGDDFICCPNDGVGGGYCKDNTEEGWEDFKIESVRDVETLLSESLIEEEGWFCY